MEKRRRIRQKAAWVVTGMVLAGAVSGDTVSRLKAETRETEEKLTEQETPEQQGPREACIAEAEAIPALSGIPGQQSSAETESPEPGGEPATSDNPETAGKTEALECENNVEVDKESWSGTESEIELGLEG